MEIELEPSVGTSPENEPNEETNENKIWLGLFCLGGNRVLTWPFRLRFITVFELRLLYVFYF